MTVVQRHEHTGHIQGLLLSSWNGKVLAESQDAMTHRA